MIIFDLDTLADCEHRRHFVDPNKNPDYEYSNFGKDPITREMTVLEFPNWHRKDNVDIRFKPDWKSFYEACDKDDTISEVINVYTQLRYTGHVGNIEIWSGRCESVRDKTEKWLENNDIYFDKLKMRPIGDNTPDDELKELWVREYYDSMYPKLDKDAIEGTEYYRKDRIEFVFDSDTKSIEMFRRRGIFVF